MATHLEFIDARDIPKNIEWFKTFLADRGAPLVPNSPLAKALAQLERYGAIITGKANVRTSRKEARELLGDALPLDFLIRAVHLGADVLRDEFDWLRMRSSDVLVTRAATRSADRDLTFELIAAAACTTFAKDVRREEPDVAATYNGRRFGFACKILYSPNESQNEKLLSAGVKQIEIDRAKVDRGFVLMNLVNRLPHGRFFPDASADAFKNAQDAVKEVEGWGFAFNERLAKKVPFVTRIARHAPIEKRKTRGFMAMLPTLIDVGGEANTILWTQVLPFVDDADDRAFLLAFHRALQDIPKHRIT